MVECSSDMCRVDMEFSWDSVYGVMRISALYIPSSVLRILSPDFPLTTLFPIQEAGMHHCTARDSSFAVAWEFPGREVDGQYVLCCFGRKLWIEFVNRG